MCSILQRERAKREATGAPERGIHRRIVGQAVARDPQRLAIERARHERRGTLLFHL